MRTQNAKFIAQKGASSKADTAHNPQRCSLSFALVVLSWMSFSGCTYSFTGASVPPHLKTIAIPAVDDQSGFGDPNLRELFTKELTQQFTSDNTLEIGERNTADCVLEGVLTDVRDMPAVLEQGENVSQRRITITVRMAFQDLKLRKKVWEKTFTQYSNYSSGGAIAKRDDGIQEAVRKLTEDILNETVAGW